MSDELKRGAAPAPGSARLDGEMVIALFDVLDAHKQIANANERLLGALHKLESIRRQMIAEQPRNE